MSNVYSKTISLGYSPITFPRDPIFFNQYAEHVLIGQILMPLVETDFQGNLVGGVAKKWEFMNSGKTIVFYLDNKKFSNGNTISSIDVKYTIERNIKLKSQSSEYLKNILEIKIPTSDQIIFKLKEKDQSILKALSRDQLGIVPNGWLFDSKSDSPYVSSSAYNLKKENGNWYLKNNNISSNELDFKLVFYENDKYDIPKMLPDLTLQLNTKDLAKLKKMPNASEYIEEELPSFVQNLFWITKNSSLFKNITMRKKIGLAFNEALLNYFKIHDSNPATGIIPIGISGAILSRVEYSPDISSEKNNSYKEYTLLYMSGNHDKFIKSEELKNSLKKYKIIIKFTSYLISDNLSQKSMSADIVATSIAGGFNDPMGFIGILHKIFGISFEDYLPSDLRIYYIDAKNEVDWSKRTKLFEILNQKIMTNSFCIAGWRPKFYSFKNLKINSSNSLYRYTPRLINYSISESK